MYAASRRVGGARRLKACAQQRNAHLQSNKIYFSLFSK